MQSEHTMERHWQARINEALNQEYQWQFYAKGSSNQLFKGSLQACNSGQRSDTPIIARINGPESLTPGVNRAREALLLQQLTGFTWAPQVLLNAPEAGWCVMRHYQTLGGGELSAAQQQQLLQAIAELQMIKPPDQLPLLLIDYPQLIEENYQPLAKQRTDSKALQQIAAFKQALAALPEIPECLVHHDLHPGNLMLDTDSDINSQHMQNPYSESIPQSDTINNTDRQSDGKLTQQQLVILDWEYSGLGNAWFDAAGLHRCVNIAPESLISLPAFRHLKTDEFHHGLNAAIEISEMLDALWQWARNIRQHTSLSLRGQPSPQHHA